MTRPARILLATKDPERQRFWSEALRTARCQVLTDGDAEDVDVLVIDQPLSEAGVPLDEDRLGRGHTGLVAVGIGLPADVSLPADHSPRELRLACLLLSEIIRLRRQREAARRQERILTHLALSDPLTGLPNRRAWDQQLPERLTALADATPCCLALVDVDHFKDVNDRLGLLEGDACLRRIADRLSDAVRREGFVARLGGDEFAVLLEGVPPREAAAAVERLRVKLGEDGDASSGRPPLVLSAGWTALAAPASRSILADALQQADAALRAAKQAGRNRTCGSVEPAMSPI
jgi:diguanylate cyclase (GGDEF)-like protein